MRFAIPHVPVAGRVGVQTSERRREYRVVNCTVADFLQLLDRISENGVESISAFFSHLIGLLGPHLAANVLFVDDMHVLHHRLGHFLRLFGFTINVLDYCTLEVAGYDIAVDWASLPETPAAAYCLVELFE